MKYYAIFDNQGNRVTTYVEGVHENIPKEAIAITEEDQELYCTDEYIRGTNGKLQKKPPYTPTEAEKLTQYRRQRDVLLQSTDKIMLLPDYTIAGKLLIPQQRQELLGYRQSLRDAPEESYPDWPVVPAWLKL